MTRSAPAALALLLAALPLSGCSNDCQQLCKEIADYWDDCGKSFGDDELADCRKTFKKGNEIPGDAEGTTYIERYEGACATLLASEEDADGEPSTALRARFTCEDMDLGPGGAFGAVAAALRQGR